MSRHEMRHDPGMARARLNSGALTAGQVRMGSRGASERLRPPGDDINSPAEPAGCGWCGSHKQVDDSRPRRCGPCRVDEQVVRDVTAALRAAGQPPLGRKSLNGAPYAAQRRQGEAARARLRSRKRTLPTARNAVASPQPAKKPTGSRRVTPGQKKAGAQRLRQRVAQLQRELEGLDRGDARRSQLRQEIAAAHRLLDDWQEGVH